MSQYTSDLEFSLEKRVQITNEIPPYDMYDALNSVMQTTVKNGVVVPSVWQWILGYSRVEYDLPFVTENYNEETGEFSYKRSIENEDVYYKMVNGKVAETYGPASTADEKGLETKFHRMEEYGVLLPEFDFLLHEVYRYLGSIYPNHPDYTELLTDNEFNDFITQAAAVIGYEPDNLFFDKLTSSLGLSADEQLKEAAMCKIRNLRNEAFRRKLYGSKMGYRMLANEILRTVTVFPVATYLPLNLINNEFAQNQLDISDDISRLNAWNLENGLNFDKDNYIKYIRQHNRKIDTFSKNYYKKLRLIDYDGSTSGYTEKDKNIYMFGLVTPFNQYSICEFPACSDVATKLATLKTGLQCNNSGVETFISEINEDISCSRISIDETSGKPIEQTFTDIEHHSFNVVAKQDVNYKDISIYPPFAEVFETITNAVVSDAGYSEFHLLKGIFNNSHYVDVDSVIKHIKATINPRCCDTILLTPSEALKFYPDSVKRSKSDVYSSDIVWDKTELRKKQVIATLKAKDDSSVDIKEAAEIIDYTKGYISITPYASEQERTLSSDTKSKEIDEDERYGVIIENELGKKIALIGKLSVSEDIINSSYCIIGEKFFIGAIPEYKDERLLNLIYGEEYTELVDKINEIEEKLVLAETNNGFSRGIAESYLAGNDVSVIIESEKDKVQDYKTYISWVGNYNELVEKLNVMKQNRSNLYSNENGNDVSLVNSGAKVISFFNCYYGNGNVHFMEDTMFATGTISEMNLGNLNCASIIHNSVPADYQYVVKSTIGENSYPEVAAQYISRVDSGTNWDKAFSSLDVKLQYEIAGYAEKSNVTCFDYDRTDIKIESTIDTSIDGKENMITFESDVSKELFKTLSVGDIVTGPTIDSDDEDVYITEIGDDYIYISQKLKQSGTYVLTYSVRNNITIDDISDDVIGYKRTLYENGLYTVFNPFNEGLYPSASWPNVSNAILDSLADISLFDLHNVKGQYAYKKDDYGEFILDEFGEKVIDYKENKDTFTLIMEEVYYDSYKPIRDRIDNSIASHNLLMPSDIKFNNELFVEFNLNSLIDYKTKTGAFPVLMSADWLDYISNSLGYSSRATDKVNVGTNLMMETDTSGYYSLISGAKYTDPNIKLKFITMNFDGLKQWPEVNEQSNDVTVPVYAQIGIGGSGRRRWFKSIDDVTYPNIWGVNIYDEYKYPKDIKDKRGNITHYGYDEDSDFYKNDGELRKASVYGQTSTMEIDISDSDYYKNVESPVMEIPLGEYDTVLRYKNEESGSGLLTITQASFYSQTFKKLLKFFDNETVTEEENPCNIYINGADINQNDLLIPLPYKATSWYQDTASIAITNSNVAYMADWVPEKNENSVLQVPLTLGNRYYTLASKKVVNNIKTVSGGTTSKSFDSATVAIRYNENWILKDFQFAGLLGDGLDTVDPSTVDLEKGETGTKVYVTSDTNECPTPMTEDGPGINLLERLIQYCARLDTNISNADLAILNKYTYLNNNGNEQVEMRTGVAATKVHNLEQAISYMPLLQNSSTGIQLSDGTVLYQGTIPFFTYVGGTEYENYLAQYNITNLSVGDSVCLVNLAVPNEDGVIDKYIWQLYKLNRDSILGMSIPMTKYGNMPETEFAAAVGNKIAAYSYINPEDGTKRTEYIDTSKVSITSKIDNINSSFTLPRSFVTEGTYEFNFTVDPKFIGEGYVYNSDGTIDRSVVKTFDITKGSIYYDEKNECFYMYSNEYKNDSRFDNSEVKKFAIKFNEQKYFKNVLNTSCVYQVKDTLDAGKSTTTSTPTLSPIEDVAFNVDKISIGDRLLQVNSIDLRSIYNRAFEPILFSNYLDIDYNIRGITEDGRVYLSYVPRVDSIVEKNNFNILIKDFMPSEFKYDEDGASYTSVNYPDETIDFVNDDTILYEAPSFTNIRFTKPLTSDNFDKPDVNRDFAYFKNNLVFKASVDLNNPSLILPAEDDTGLFDKALAKITVGDTLVSGYALTDVSGEDNKISVRLTVDGAPINETEKLQQIRFTSSKFAAVTKAGRVYYNNNCSIIAISSELECSTAQFILSDNETSLADGQSVTDISYDTDNNKWVVEVANNNAGSTLYNFDPLTPPNSNGTIRLEQMYTSESRVLVGEYTEDSVEYQNAFGSELGAISSVELNGHTHNTSTSPEEYEAFNNSIIAGVAGDKYILSNDGDVQSYENMVYTKDFALNSAVLVKNTKDFLEGSTVYEPIYNANISNEPYKVDTQILDYTGSSVPVSDSSNSRAFTTFDSTGRYGLYAKGRDLFIKSPTATVGEVEDKDGNKYYDYDGQTTSYSYWKYARVPIFSDRNKAVYRFTEMSTLSDYIVGIGSSVNDYLSNWNSVKGSITVDGRAISSGDAAMVNNIKLWIGNLSKVATFDQFVESIEHIVKDTNDHNYNSGNYEPTSYNFKVIYNRSNSDYSIKIQFRYFDIVNKTIADKLYTSGVCNKEVAVFGATNTFSYYIPMKSDLSGFNYEVAYADYVYYLSMVLGYNLDNTVKMSSNIVKAQFTDSKLYLIDEQGFVFSTSIANLTKRDDIENINNWAVSHYPEDFIYKFSDSKLVNTFYFEYAADGGNKLISIPQSDNICIGSIFKPMCSYIKGNVVLIGGYTLPADSIKTVFESTYGAGENTELLNALLTHAKYNDYTTPTVMYSTNGGVSFEVATLPALEGTVNKNYKITSIRFTDSKFYFYCSTDINETLNDQSYALAKSSGVYNFASPVLCKLTEKDKEFSICEQYDIDFSVGSNNRTATTASDINSGLAGVSVPSTKFRLYLNRSLSYFFVASASVVNTMDITVDEKDAGYVMLSGNILPVGSGSAEVLLSFNVASDIVNQYEFLDNDRIASYINEFGDLKVSEVTQVSGKETANRFYSYRELLSAEDKVNDTIGYPAHDEDEDNVYYTYSEVVDEDENTVKSMDIMKNDSGTEIKICDASGNYLFINGDTSAFNNFALRRDVDISIFDSAYNTAYTSIEAANSDPNARKLDKVMMGILGTQKVKADYISSNEDRPYVIVNLGATVSVISEFKELLFSDTGKFLTYIRATTGEADTEAQLRGLTYVDENGTAQQKYTLKKHNKVDYWFDNELGIFPINVVRYMSSMVYMPYTHGGEMVKFKNATLDNIYKEDSDIELPITGIYLNNHGYGGSRSNDDMWKYKVPWNIDPYAFENTFVKNINGDYVYLTDALGNEIISYNSEMFINNGERSSISRNVFGDKLEKEITLGSEDTGDGITWKVGTNFVICEPAEPKIYAAYDLDAFGEPTPIRIYNGSKPVKVEFHEPFFVYKSGRNMYDELDNMYDDGRKFKVEFNVSAYYNNKTVSDYVDASNYISIDKNYLRIKRAIYQGVNGEGEEVWTDVLQPSAFHINIGGRPYAAGLISSYKVTYSYKGKLYSKEFPIEFERTSENPLKLPSPSVEFLEEVPIVVHDINYTCKSANVNSSFEDIKGKYAATRFNFNNMVDNNNTSLNVKFIPQEPEMEGVAADDVLNGHSMVCNNPGSFSTSGPLVYVANTKSTGNTLTFNISDTYVTSYEEAPINLSLDTSSFEVSLPVIPLGKITTCYYNDWDIKKRAVGQEEFRTLEFAVFLDDERLDDKYEFILEEDESANVEKLLACKLKSDDSKNFVFDKVVLADNMEDADNRDDEFRLKPWTAYEKITLSTCGNTEDFDYHKIKFPIGVIDTYLGYFVGVDSAGFNEWTLTYNGVNVKEYFEYTYEDAVPYLSSISGASDKLYEISHTGTNVLVLHIDYDMYEETFEIPVEWHRYYSSPRIMKVTPFVVKTVEKKDEPYNVGGYLMDTNITYNTTFADETLVDVDNSLDATKVDFGYEIESTVMPDYLRSQELVSSFLSVINSSFDTYEEVNNAVKGLDFNFDDLKSVFNSVAPNFGEASEIRLRGWTDDASTATSSAFNTYLSGLPTTNFVQSGKKSMISNVYNHLGYLREELAEIKDNTNTQLQTVWNKSNYSNIPAAIESMEEYIKGYGFNYGGKTYNDFNKNLSTSNFEVLPTYNTNLESFLTSNFWNLYYETGSSEPSGIIKSKNSLISGFESGIVNATLPTVVGNNNKFYSVLKTLSTNTNSYLTTLYNTWKYDCENIYEHVGGKYFAYTVDRSLVDAGSDKDTIDGVTRTWSRTPFSLNSVYYANVLAVKTALDNNAFVDTRAFNSRYILSKSARTGFIKSYFEDLAGTQLSNFRTLYGFNNLIATDSLSKARSRIFDFKKAEIAADANFASAANKNWISLYDTLLSECANRVTNQAVEYTLTCSARTTATQATFASNEYNVQKSYKLDTFPMPKSTLSKFALTSENIDYWLSVYPGYISGIQGMIKDATAAKAAAEPYKTEVESHKYTLLKNACSDILKSFKDGTAANSANNSSAFIAHNEVITNSDSIKNDIVDNIKTNYNTIAGTVTPYNGLIASRANCKSYRDKINSNNCTYLHDNIDNNITASSTSVPEYIKTQKSSISISGFDGNGYSSINSKVPYYLSSTPPTRYENYTYSTGWFSTATGTRETSKYKTWSSYSSYHNKTSFEKLQKVISDLADSLNSQYSSSTDNSYWTIYDREVTYKTERRNDLIAYRNGVVSNLKRITNDIKYYAEPLISALEDYTKSCNSAISSQLLKAVNAVNNILAFASKMGIADSSTSSVRIYNTMDSSGKVSTKAYTFKKPASYSDFKSPTVTSYQNNFSISQPAFSNIQNPTVNDTKNWYSSYISDNVTTIYNAAKSISGASIATNNWWTSDTYSSTQTTANNRISDLASGIESFYSVCAAAKSEYTKYYVGSNNSQATVVTYYKTMFFPNNSYNKFRAQILGLNTLVAAAADNAVYGKCWSDLKGNVVSQYSFNDPNWNTTTLNGETMGAITLGSESSLDSLRKDMKELYKNAVIHYNKYYNLDSWCHTAYNNNVAAISFYNSELTKANADLAALNEAKAKNVSNLTKIFNLETVLECRTSMNDKDFLTIGKSQQYSTYAGFSKTQAMYEHLKSVYNTSAGYQYPDNIILYYKETSADSSEIKDINASMSTYMTKLPTELYNLMDSVIMDNHNNYVLWSSKETTIRDLDTIARGYITSASDWETTRMQSMQNTYNSVLKNCIIMEVFKATAVNRVNSKKPQSNKFLIATCESLVSLINTKVVQNDNIATVKSNVNNFLDTNKNLMTAIYNLFWHNEGINYTSGGSSWVSSPLLDPSYGWFNQALKQFTQYYAVGVAYCGTTSGLSFSIKNVMDYKINEIVSRYTGFTNASIANGEWDGYAGRMFLYYLKKLYDYNFAKAQDTASYALDTDMNVDYVRSLYVLNNFNVGVDSSLVNKDIQGMSMNYKTLYNYKNISPVNAAVVVTKNTLSWAPSEKALIESENLEREESYSMGPDGMYIITQKLSSTDSTNDRNKMTDAFVQNGAINNKTIVYINKTPASSGVPAMPANFGEFEFNLPIFANSIYTPENSKDKIKRAIPTIVGDGKYYLDTDGKPFVLYDGVDNVDFKVIRLDINLSETVYINGVEGPVMLRKPKYKSFYNLLQSEGYVIVGDVLVSTAIKPEADIDDITNALDTTKTLTNFSDKSTDNKSIKLVDKISTSKVDLNDGEPHYISIKVLTQDTILTNAVDCNERKTYEEISLADYDKFTPDRVWFNENGYPLPPVVIGNTVFNSENNYAFTSNSFENNNGYSVYRCNEAGQIIGYQMISKRSVGEIDPAICDGGIIKDNAGDVSKGAVSFVLDGTYDLTLAHVPNKPRYNSCVDWFKSGFYLSGHESNPFWQVLKISSKYSTSKKNWVQYYKVQEYERATADMTLVDVDESERFVNIASTITYSKGETANGITIKQSDEYVDLTKGKINFIMLKPALTYKETPTFVKYGITAKNTFCAESNYMGQKQSSIWSGQSCNMATYVELNYTVNSTKNFANKNDPDSDIVEVTELGLFNKNHELIAYSTFPPIEYHTNSQHVSFTCYVKNGNLTPPGTEGDDGALSTIETKSTNETES